VGAGNSISLQIRYDRIDAPNGLPIVTGLFGLGAGLGLIALGSRLVDMVDFSSDLALMIGSASASTTRSLSSPATATPTARRR